MEREFRTELRKKIMTILYQINVYNNSKIDFDLDEIIKEVAVIDNEFIKETVYGIETYKTEIDKLANKHLTNWTIDRLGNTDIAILRLAIYE